MLKPCLNLAAVLAIAFLSTSCAEPGRPGLRAAPNIMPEVVGANKSIQQSVTATDVIGGTDTNPVWTSQVSSAGFKFALENSLRNSVLLAGIPSKARFAVSAQLIELEQRFVGISMTVTSRVSYHVIEREGSKVFMNEEITTPYTASFNSSLNGADRLRLANEGSIRANIGEFVTRFIEKWVARSKSKTANTSNET